MRFTLEKLTRIFLQKKWNVVNLFVSNFFFIGVREKSSFFSRRKMYVDLRFWLIDKTHASVFVWR